jgi:hypothetical protein
MFLKYKVVYYTVIILPDYVINKNYTLINKYVDRNNIKLPKSLIYHHHHFFINKLISYN